MFILSLCIRVFHLLQSILVSLFLFYCSYINDSDTGDSINLMSQAFPQYALARTLKRKKKRGWQKGRRMFYCFSGC